MFLFEFVCAMCSEWIVIVSNIRCSLNLNYNFTNMPFLQLLIITESGELFSQIKTSHVVLNCRKRKPRKLHQNEINSNRINNSGEKKRARSMQHGKQCLSNRCIIYIVESENGSIDMVLRARSPNCLHKKKSIPSDYFANLFIN